MPHGYKSWLRTTPASVDSFSFVLVELSNLLRMPSYSPDSPRPGETFIELVLRLKITVPIWGMPKQSSDPLDWRASADKREETWQRVARTQIVQRNASIRRSTRCLSGPTLTISLVCPSTDVAGMADVSRADET